MEKKEYCDKCFKLKKVLKTVLSIYGDEFENSQIVAVMSMIIAEIIKNAENPEKLLNDYLQTFKKSYKHLQD